MSRHQDRNPDDDDQQEQGSADRQPPDERPQTAGKPTGEKQAAANREVDPPA
jgi:hypothetical protein